MKKKIEKKLEKVAKSKEHTKRPPQGTSDKKKRITDHGHASPTEQAGTTTVILFLDLLSGASVQDYNVLYNIQFIFVENLVTLNIQVWLSPGINIIPWSIALIISVEIIV